MDNEILDKFVKWTEMKIQIPLFCSVEEKKKEFKMNIIDQATTQN